MALVVSVPIWDILCPTWESGHPLFLVKQNKQKHEFGGVRNNFIYSMIGIHPNDILDFDLQSSYHISQ